MFISGFMAIRRFMAARTKKANIVRMQKFIPEKT